MAYGNTYDYLRQEAQRRLEEEIARQRGEGLNRLGLGGGENAALGAQDPQPVQTPDVPLTRPRRVEEVPPTPGTAGRPRYTEPISFEDTNSFPRKRPYNYGAEPLDQAIKYRQALEDYQPSGGSRSIKNIGAGGGYGVLSALDNLRSNASPDEAGTAAIGGGIAGLLASIFKPSSKNAMRRNVERGPANAEVAHQLKIAGEQARLKQSEVNPYLREIGLNQGQQRIDNTRAKMDQDRLLAHKRALASIFNSYPEFDPDDPKNAAIVAAMNAVGLPVTKKSRGSLLQLVQGTDESGNATFSIVHKSTGTAEKVTGEGLPAKTEQQLGREAAATRQRYAQGEINKRNAANLAARGTSSKTKGLTPAQVQARKDKASGLVARIKSARTEAERLQKQANENPQYKAFYEGERDKVLQKGNEAATELNEKYGDDYEAGPGEGNYPYYKARERDPKVQKYADEYFGGNYGAAQEAIRKQRGQ